MVICKLYFILQLVQGAAIVFVCVKCILTHYDKFNVDQDNILYIYIFYSLGWTQQYGDSRTTKKKNFNYIIEIIFMKYL